MKDLHSSRPRHVALSVVLSSLIVAFVGGAGLANCLDAGALPSLELPLQLMLVCVAFALTLVLHLEHGDAVLQWMADRFWVRLLVWVVFGVALGSVLWDLLQMEFVMQLRSFKG